MINKVSDAVAGWVHNLFETKIASYREFRPLDILLEKALEEKQMAYQRVLYYPSVWYDKCLHDELSLNVRSGSTTLYRVGDAVIKTQSVTPSGSAHKRKELVGRAVSIGYTARTGKAMPLRIKRILLIDGTFTDEDLQSFGQAGWSGIYYPDEVEDLVKDLSLTSRPK